MADQDFKSLCKAVLAQAKNLTGKEGESLKRMMHLIMKLDDLPSEKTEADACWSELNELMRTTEENTVKRYDKIHGVLIAFAERMWEIISGKIMLHKEGAKGCLISMLTLYTSYYEEIRPPRKGREDPGGIQQKFTKKLLHTLTPMSRQCVGFLREVLWGAMESSLIYMGDKDTFYNSWTSSELGRILFHMDSSAGAMSIIESVGHLASFFVRASEQDKTDHKRKTYLENLFDAKLLKKELSDQCIAAVEKGYTDLNLWAGVVNRLMLLLFPQSRNARVISIPVTKIVNKNKDYTDLNHPMLFLDDMCLSFDDLTRDGFENGDLQRINFKDILSVKFSDSSMDVKFVREGTGREMEMVLMSAEPFGSDFRKRFVAFERKDGAPSSTDALQCPDGMLKLKDRKSRVDVICGSDDEKTEDETDEEEVPAAGKSTQIKIPLRPKRDKSDITTQQQASSSTVAAKNQLEPAEEVSTEMTSTTADQPRRVIVAQQEAVVEEEIQQSASADPIQPSHDTIEESSGNHRARRSNPVQPDSETRSQKRNRLAAESANETDEIETFGPSKVESKSGTAPFQRNTKSEAGPLVSENGKGKQTAVSAPINGQKETLDEAGSSSSSRKQYGKKATAEQLKKETAQEVQDPSNTQSGSHFQNKIQKDVKTKDTSDSLPSKKTDAQPKGRKDSVVPETSSVPQSLASSVRGTKEYTKTKPPQPKAQAKKVASKSKTGDTRMAAIETTYQAPPLRSGKSSAADNKRTSNVAASDADSQAPSLRSEKPSAANKSRPADAAPTDTDSQNPFSRSGKAPTASKKAVAPRPEKESAEAAGSETLPAKTNDLSAYDKDRDLVNTDPAKMGKSRLESVVASGAEKVPEPTPMESAGRDDPIEPPARTEENVRKQAKPDFQVAAEEEQELHQQVGMRTAQLANAERPAIPANPAVKERFDIPPRPDFIPPTAPARSRQAPQALKLQAEQVQMDVDQPQPDTRRGRKAADPALKAQQMEGPSTNRRTHPQTTGEEASEQMDMDGELPLPPPPLRTSRKAGTESAPNPSSKGYDRPNQPFQQRNAHQHAAPPPVQQQNATRSTVRAAAAPLPQALLAQTSTRATRSTKERQITNPMTEIMEPLQPQTTRQKRKRKEVDESESDIELMDMQRPNKRVAKQASKSSSRMVMMQQQQDDQMADEDASTGVPPHADRIHQRPPFRNERDAGTVKPLQDLDEAMSAVVAILTNRISQTVSTIPKRTTEAQRSIIALTDDVLVQTNLKVRESILGTWQNQHAKAIEMEKQIRETVQGLPRLGGSVEALRRKRLRPARERWPTAEELFA